MAICFQGRRRWVCIVYWLALTEYFRVRALCWSFFGLFINVTAPRTCDTDPQGNDTGLRIIMASVGQTGTTSVSQALRDLGVKTYHIEERYAWAWETVRDNVTRETIAAVMARCRVEAVSLEPSTDALPEFLAVSPEATVILTYRPFPSWNKSTRSGGAPKDKAWGTYCHFVLRPGMILPWPWISDLFTGGYMKRTFNQGDMFAGYGQSSMAAFLVRNEWTRVNYIDPLSDTYNRGVFKVRAQEEAYLGHINEIRTVTPAGRLLELDIRDGDNNWEKLEQLVGRKHPSGRHPAFPQPRSKDSWTNDVIFDHNKEVCNMAILLSTACHLPNFAILYCLARLLEPVLMFLGRPCRKSKEQ